MNRTVLSAALTALLLTMVLTLSATAASPQAGQCAGYNDPANTKVDTSDGSIVLDAGLTVCFKAGNGNTGAIVTDGVTTIAEYIEQSGLLNEGGQVPNISNYVIYGTAPSEAPSEGATEAPTEAPSEVPVVTPTPAPVVTATPGPVGAAHNPKITAPNTATEETTSTSGGTPNLLLFLAAVLGGSMGVYAGTVAIARNKRR